MNKDEKELALALRERLIGELKPLKKSVFRDLLSDMLIAKSNEEIQIVVGGMKTQARRENIKGQMENIRYLLSLIDTIDDEDLQKPKK